EPLQDHGPAGDPPQSPVGHGEVVADQVQLGTPVREEDLVRVGDGHLPAGDLQDRPAGPHSFTLRCRRAGPGRFGDCRSRTWAGFSSLEAGPRYRPDATRDYRRALSVWRDYSATAASEWWEGRTAAWFACFDHRRWESDVQDPPRGARPGRGHRLLASRRPHRQDPDGGAGAAAVSRRVRHHRADVHLRRAHRWW